MYFVDDGMVRSSLDECLLVEYRGRLLLPRSSLEFLLLVDLSLDVKSSLLSARDVLPVP